MVRDFWSAIRQIEIEIRENRREWARGTLTCTTRFPPLFRGCETGDTRWWIIDRGYRHTRDGPRLNGTPGRIFCLFAPSGPAGGDATATPRRGGRRAVANAR